MRPGLTAGALGPSIVSLNTNKSSSSSSSSWGARSFEPCGTALGGGPWGARPLEHCGAPWGARSLELSELSYAQREDRSQATKLLTQTQRGP